jgi:urease subunit gamma/beta
MTPGESDRLLLHLQASLAQRRRERGLKLNVPEARALLADAICEWARDGLSMVQVRELAAGFLTVDDVLPGVPDIIGDVRVEARFDDGTRLVVVAPFPGDDDVAPTAAPLPVGMLEIRNEAATPIALTSHIHLAEANPRLRMDRARAFGMRPALPTGQTQWIPAGEAMELGIIPIGGDRLSIGTSGVVEGALDDPVIRERALRLLRECGYLDVVDGTDRGDADAAETAVERLMARQLNSGQSNSGQSNSGEPS